MYNNDELIAYLINAEYDDKENQKIERLINTARFSYKAHKEDIIFNPKRNIDKNMIHRLAGCDFIKDQYNILLTESIGIGKSYIATTIEHKTCMLGYKVMYFNINKLFSKLKIAKVEETYLKEIDNFIL